MALKQKLNYFDAFEKLSDLACQEASLLIEIIEGFTTSDAVLPEISRAHRIEHEGDEVCHDIYAALADDFITPIEREDIILMTHELDEILDYTEGTIQRFYMLNVSSMHPDALSFARLLLSSCEALRSAMGDFKNFKKSKTLRSHIIAINDLEEKADELYFHVMREMYTSQRTPENAVNIFIWDKLFQRLENTADACEHVADTMGSIMMKNA